VCCTLQGEELFINGLISPYREQALALIRQRVAEVDRFVAVSEYCAEFMAGFLDIPAEKIAVVPLGINMSGYKDKGDEGAAPSSPFRIGYFARITPEKGLHLLADAYIRFRRKTGAVTARLDAAGYAPPDYRSYLEDIQRKLKEAGLEDEFSYRGVLDRDGKITFLHQLDVLSVPATYDEPKGMFLIEAMASGVPVVQPKRGAFIEIIEKTGGGLLVKPDDPDSLADALYELWRDRSAVADLGRRAFQGVRAHYRVEHSVERLLGVYDGVAAVHS
jgi:glycosyltransferase involved in cell wall biosynthesis